MATGNKIARDAFSLYVGRSVNIVLGLVSTLIYGVVFLKPQIAVINLFELFVNLFLSFGFTWSALSLPRFGKEELKSSASLSRTSSIRIGIVFPIFLASVLIILFERDRIGSFIGTGDRSIFLYLILHLFLVVCHEHITCLFTTVEDHAINVKYYVGESVGKLLILCLFYAGPWKGGGAELYIKLNVALYLLLLALRLPFVKRFYVFPVTICGREEYLKTLKYVTPQIYGFAGMYIINYVDLYFIRKYLSLDDAGAYQYLYTIFVKMSSFALILNTIFFPRIMEWKIDNDGKIRKYLEKGPNWLFAFLSAATGLFLVVYRPLFGLAFGEKYAVAYPAFNLLVLSLPFYFLTFLFVPVLNSHDRVNVVQGSNVVSAVFNVLVDYLLIARFGLVAAGLGTFAACFAKFMITSMTVERMFGVRYRLVNASSVMFGVAVLVYFMNVIVS